MVNVVVMQKEGESLEKTLSSVFYQLFVDSISVYVCTKETVDISIFPNTSIFSSWKEIREQLQTLKGNQYLYFIEAGDVISNPYTFYYLLSGFQEKADVVFGSYIIDTGESYYDDICYDYYHFFGKMYRLKSFLNVFQDSISSELLFYYHHSLNYQNKINYNSFDFRNYIVSNDHYQKDDYWKQDVLDEKILLKISDLKKKYSSKVDSLIMDCLFTSYLDYLTSHKIQNRDLLKTMIPKEITMTDSISLQMMNHQDLLLQGRITFSEYLENLKEGKIC